MKRKRYEKELRRLQGELCALQEWLKTSGQRVIVLFEGRDAAGKGGCIRAMTERVSPRVFRVVALPKPSDREKTPALGLGAESHNPFNSGAVVPAAIKNHDFTRRRDVIHVALHIDLRLSTIRWLWQGNHAKYPRTDPLGHGSNAAALARRVAPLEDDNNALTAGF